MPIAAPIQSSFNGGEFSPIMYGRTDFPRYKNGTSLMQRFVPVVQGGATRCPGTKYLKRTKANGKIRLVPFVFNSGDAFMIELGDLYLRFYQDRVPVKNATQAVSAITRANPAVVTYVGADTFANGNEVYITGVVGMTQVNGRWFKVANLNAGANTFELTDLDGNNINSTSYTAYSSAGTVASVYEIVSPYALADVENLRMVQSKDVVYIAHPDYAPRKLSRAAAASWSFSTVSFSDGPYLDINSGDTQIALTASVGGTSTTIVANSVTGINTNTGFQSTDVGRFVRWKNKAGNWTVLMITAYISTTKVTATISGSLDATTGIAISGITKANPGVITATAHGLSNGDTFYVSGVAGMTEINGLYCQAAGVTANTTQTGVNTTGFTAYTSGGFVSILGNKITGITAASPAVVTSAAHNFAVGDTVYIDGVVGMTQVNGRFYTISAKTVNTYTLAGVDSTAYTAYTSGGIASESSKSWRMGEWSATTGYPSVVFFFEDRLGWAASTVAPTTMNMSKNGDYENMAPTAANGTVAADNGLSLRFNSGTQDPIRWVVDNEKGLLVGTRGSEWVVRSATDGTAMSAINLPSAKQATHYGSAFIEPISVAKSLLFTQQAKRKIREMAYAYDVDGFKSPDLTVLSEHITKSGVLRMAYQQEPFHLVWVVRVDGTLVAMTYDREQDVVGWHRHPIGGYSDSGQSADVIVESVACIPAPDGSYDDVYIVCKRYINGGVKRYIEYLSAFSTDFDSVSDAFFVDSGVAYTGAASTLTGLEHLEGQTVSILVDGSPQPTQAVSGGAVTISPAATAKAAVGLGFLSRIKTLRPEAGSATGTAQGKIKRIHKLAAMLHQTVGLRVGRDFTTMEPLELRTGADAMSAAVPLFSGITPLDFPSDYDQDGYVCLEAYQPLPCTLLALMPQLHTQDAQ